MLHRNISPGIGAIILIAVIAAITLFGWRSWRIDVQAENQCPRALGADYCYRCHTDVKTLKAMRDKRGD